MTPLELPKLTVTWRTFAEDVLPRARAIDILVQPVAHFYGLTAAVDADAPPILQWDGLDGDARNTVAWYFHSHRSSATAQIVEVQTPEWAKS